jgi:2-polyprenyl-3-methyl-5-hydroxy-6-metoxy-1,4-benzoquinol methylase
VVEPPFEPSVDVFRCPSCVGPLADRGDEYACIQCGHRTPIRGGIPRFVEAVDGSVGQIQRVFDFEHRRYTDSQFTRFGPSLVDDFIADCELEPQFFSGLAALDAGCGSGRWTYALAELGADTTAFDLTSGGVESAHATLGERPSVRLAQANLFQLPFAPATFDFVMSWGVLHHTPNTYDAFLQLVPLVRPGGTLYVMVYEQTSRLREFGTNIVRRLLRGMSPERRYDFCRHLVIRNPQIAYRLGKLFIVQHYTEESPMEFSSVQFGLYDAYSPMYNHHHTRDEVSGWFRANGFSSVTVIDSPLGAVRVRGIRDKSPLGPRASS